MDRAARPMETQLFTNSYLSVLLPHIYIADSRSSSENTNTNNRRAAEHQQRPNSLLPKHEALLPCRSFCSCRPAFGSSCRRSSSNSKERSPRPVLPQKGLLFQAIYSIGFEYFSATLISYTEAGIST